MKLVIAVIQPFMLEKLNLALLKCPTISLIVDDVKAFGRGISGDTEPLADRCRLECVVDDDKVEQVVTTISQVAGTGGDADGYIMVCHIDRIYSMQEATPTREVLS